jgi:hypothetical protein
MNRRISITLIARALLFSAVVLLVSNVNSVHAKGGPGDRRNNFDPYAPIFTKSEVTIAKTADMRFTSTLLANAFELRTPINEPPDAGAYRVLVGSWKPR